MRPLSRVQPNGPVQGYKTYQILAPAATHRREATCTEVNCRDYASGWKVRVEGLDPQMLHTARTSGRKFTELHVAEGENWLLFEAGQPCFRAALHTVPLDKQEIFIARDGDYRGNPTGRVLKHTRPEHWIEDMQENNSRVRDRLERG